MINLCAGRDDDGRRLDRVLRRALRGAPLSAIHRLLRLRLVKVNGVPAGAAFRLRAGDLVSVVSGDFASGEEIPSAPRRAGAPVDVPSIIVLETDDFLFVNKPAGIVSHGSESLSQAVNEYLDGKLPPSLSFRPGPLHRLDFGTSGLIAFGKSREGAAWFSHGLRTGLFRKTYFAKLSGILRGSREWNDYLLRDDKLRITRVTDAAAPGAKNAKTFVTEIASENGATFAKIETGTGRTHQIRAQASAHGHPLEGDSKYSGSGSGAYFLHAYSVAQAKDNPFSLPPLIRTEVPEIMRALNAGTGFLGL